MKKKNRINILYELPVCKNLLDKCRPIPLTSLPLDIYVTILIPMMYKPLMNSLTMQINQSGYLKTCYLKIGLVITK